MILASAVLPSPAADVDRGEAQRLAREELSRSVYAEAEPSLVERLWDLVADLLQQLTEEVVAALPGGWWTLVPLLLLVAALAVALLAYLRPSRRARDPVLLAPSAAPLTAEQHRRRAEESAERGDWATAVRERLRAINRAAEDRALLTVHPGRTATELAVELAAQLPESASALHAGARLFNEVTYGRRAADRADYDEIAGLDERLRASRAASTAAPPGDTGAGPAREGGQH